MKNNVFVILVPIFWIIGTFVSSMQLYASLDEKVHLLEGSLFYFAASVLIFSILVFIKNESKYLKWVTITSILLFTLFGTVFSLICLYASPMPNEQINPLASAIFFLSGAVASSGVNFFIKNSKV